MIVSSYISPKAVKGQATAATTGAAPKLQRRYAGYFSACLQARFRSG